MSIPPLGEIRLGGVKLDEVPGSVVTLALEAPFGAVFVMNRFGATVARYLDRSSISQGDGSVGVHQS